MHVATTTIEQLLDYTLNTPEDRLTSATSVEDIYTLINKNRKLTGA
jgi:4-O-beta-D-mannosyl-D-glucose phosphorylase